MFQREKSAVTLTSFGRIDLGATEIIVALIDVLPERFLLRMESREQRRELIKYMETSLKALFR